MFDYPVTLTADDVSVLVTFPDVPEAITFGSDADEASMYAVDALECAKLGVYQAMTQGIKKSELTRRLGWHLPQVDRLYDLQGHSANFLGLPVGV